MKLSNYPRHETNRSSIQGRLDTRNDHGDQAGAANKRNGSDPGNGTPYNTGIILNFPP